MKSLAELPGAEEQQRIIIKEKTANLLGLLDSAYSLNDGIGCHSSAVLKLTTRKGLNARDVSTLLEVGSDFLNNSYTADLRDRKTGLMTRVGPYKTSPFLNEHLGLFDERDEAYTRVNTAASKLSLSEGDYKIEKMQLLILKAATLKLASMLGLLDQLTFDARALGIQVQKDYKPSPLDKWELEWERTFGEPLPDIQTLYKDARSALITNASYGGNHAHHLLLLPHLSYLQTD